MKGFGKAATTILAASATIDGSLDMMRRYFGGAFPVKVEDGVVFTRDDRWD